jgi:purine-binding chemotaxis protein CheW
MQSQSDLVYLIFRLQDTLFGVEALSVLEIVELPELSPVAEAPEYIVGILNWRGKIVPVMDPNLRMGQAAHEYRLTDQVIILEYASMFMGIIVDGVRDTIKLQAAQIDNVPSYGIGQVAVTRFISGVAKAGDDLIMLLDTEKLVRLSDPTAMPTDSKRPVFAPSASVEEKRILRQRAHDLRMISQDEDRTGLLPFAVFKLNGEFFGADLGLVREFADLHDVTPIPCCPNHIVGLTNLRGDLLTLVDIRASVNLPLQIGKPHGKVLVVEIQDLVAARESGRLGILVDEVVDVVHLRPADIGAAPASAKSSRTEYLKGTGAYGSALLSILDLARLFKNEALVVNEQA